MKRIETAFNGQSHRDKTDDHQKGHVVLSGLNQADHRLMGILHQKMSGDVVKHGQTDQKESGPDQTHHHISGSGDQRPPASPDHDHTAGGDGVDFHKDVGRKQIVGVDNRQQRA